MHKSFYFAVTCCRYGVQALCSERIALTNQTTTPAFFSWSPLSWPSTSSHPKRRSNPWPFAWASPAWLGTLCSPLFPRAACSSPCLFLRVPACEEPQLDRSLLLLEVSRSLASWEGSQAWLFGSGAYGAKRGSRLACARRSRPSTRKQRALFYGCGWRPRCCLRSAVYERGIWGSGRPSRAWRGEGSD